MDTQEESEEEGGSSETLVSLDKRYVTHPMVEIQQQLSLCMHAAHHGVHVVHIWNDDRLLVLSSRCLSVCLSVSFREGANMR